MNKERFFGLHFDFHADNETEIGLRTNAENIEKYIEAAKPDFIQCDCKGHPGNSSYPTKVGHMADNLKADNLRIWVETAHKHGIPIFMHYSGVWDAAYTKAHPEHAVVNEKGEITEKASLFSPYVDNLLIPQLKELITEYGIDGAWVDGECWAVERDYSENAKPYLKEGITKYEHNEIMRKAYLRYLKHYIDEIHAFNPEFKFTSNWAYSSYIPEKPEADVDFISGDFPPNDSVHWARYEGRCISCQKKPWDLMAWAFDLESWCDKPAVQLIQEAAAVMMLGGGFQMYITQNKDGSIRVKNVDRLKEVSDFVHKRKMTFNKETYSQIGIYCDADSRYKMSDIFNPAGSTDALHGVLNSVLDGGLTAEIVLQYQIDEIDKYNVLIVPEWKDISDENKAKLIKYAENGGNLIVIGGEATTQFGKLIGEEFNQIRVNINNIDCRDWHGLSWIEDEESGIFSVIRIGSTVDVKKGEGYIYINHDRRDHIAPSYRIDNIGSGKIAFVPFDFGTNYHKVQTLVYISYIKNLICKMTKPYIELNRRFIDVSMLKGDNGKILLNLLNMNQGRHSLTVGVYDEIPAIYDIEIKINKPYKNVNMPLGEEFECKILEDSVIIKLKKLDVHTIIELS